MSVVLHPLRRRTDPLTAHVIRYLGLFLTLVASGGLVLYGKEPWSGIAGMALLVASGLVLSRLELLHPYTWYLPILFLYSASVPVLVLVGARPDIGSLQETIYVQWLGMCAFMLAVGPPSSHRPLHVPAMSHVRLPAQLLFVAALSLSALYVYGILASGLTTKFAIALSSSPLLRLGAAFSVLALSFAVLLADTFRRRHLPWLLVPATLAWVVLAFVYSGERALIFRILWLVLILTHALYYRITAKLLLVIGAGALILVSILSDYKARHLSEFEYVSASAPFTTAEVAQVVFADEFVTASENLQILIESSPWPRFHGETLIWDLEQVLQVGERRAGPSPTAFFNNYFFPDYIERGGGRGFTLAGEGYMNFGPLGAALWFGLLGLFVRFLHGMSRRHLLWLVIYTVSMPLVAYATRADFSNILSPFLKHIAGPVLLILCLRQLILGRQKRALKPCGRIFSFDPAGKYLKTTNPYLDQRIDNHRATVRPDP